MKMPPLKVLGYASRAQGHHLTPMRKHFEPPPKPTKKEKKGGVDPKFWEMSYWNRGGAKNDDRFINDKGNLPNDEYRFWIGSDFKGSSYAKCRGCGHVMMFGESRKAHMDAKGCTKILVAAYKLLDKDGLCVMCDKKTHVRKWGVPLCSEHCQLTWKFRTWNEESLTHAISVVSRDALLAAEGSNEEHKSGVAPDQAHRAGFVDTSGTFSGEESDEGGMAGPLLFV